MPTPFDSLKSALDALPALVSAAKTEHDALTAPAPAPTPAPTPAPAPAPPPVGTGFRPSQCSVAVDDAIHKALARISLPRWFLYAMCQRESSFNPLSYNPNGGYGLTQLTGSWYSGQLYPENLQTPDNNNQGWHDDMGLGLYGPWISMQAVTPLTPLTQPVSVSGLGQSTHGGFDALANLLRFATGYAVPAFKLWKSKYGVSNNEALRATAYHWNHGIFKAYSPGQQDDTYLTGQYGYDAWVAQFKPPCEAEDGVWTPL